MRSTVAVNGSGGPVKPVDAESLAAAALLAEETAPLPEKEEAPAAKKIQIHCPGCDHLFEVDSDMQGKNTRCPECGNVFRVPKIIEDKPADWRDAHKKKPSLAKVEEPAPAGVWEDQRKGVSAEAIRQAAADEYEEEEEPGERRFRLLKKVSYALTLIVMVVFTVMYITRTRVDNKREELMAKALGEIKESQPRPELLAALYRYDAEYQLNSAGKKREAVEAARRIFEEARGQLQQPQKIPDDEFDRKGMLLELGLAQTLCGGDLEEINKDQRLPWDKVQTEIRKTLILITDEDLRERAVALLARKLAEKEQGLRAIDIAKSCSSGDKEYLQLAGRVGIELYLAGNKEALTEVLKKTGQKATSPTLTALWLAVNPEGVEPPANIPHINPRALLPKPDERYAYAQGRALQGRISQALEIANASGDEVDRATARLLIAEAAIQMGKTSEAGPILDTFKSDKSLLARPWRMLRVVELSAQAGRMDVAQAVLDPMKGNPVEPWARLQMFRIKLAADPKQKADDASIQEIDANRLPAALAHAEAARRNIFVGENSYRRLTVEGLPKGTLRPFGYAGIALGEQDRNSK